MWADLLTQLCPIWEGAVFATIREQILCMLVLPMTFSLRTVLDYHGTSSHQKNLPVTTENTPQKPETKLRTEIRQLS